MKLKRLSSLLHSLALLGCMMAALSGLAPVAQAQFGKKQSPVQARSVSGQVTGAEGAAVKDAVVYLKNTKSLAIKSFISEPNGSYEFRELSPNVDYQVWAESNGQKSAVKNISSFDGRAQFHIDLHVGGK